MVCEDHSSRMFLHAMTSSVRNDIHMYNKWREHVKLCRQMGGEKCYLASAHELIFLNRSPPSPSPFPFPFPSPLPIPLQFSYLATHTHERKQLIPYPKSQSTRVCFKTAGQQAPVQAPAKCHRHSTECCLIEDGVIHVIE